MLAGYFDPKILGPWVFLTPKYFQTHPIPEPNKIHHINRTRTTNANGFLNSIRASSGGLIFGIFRIFLCEIIFTRDIIAGLISLGIFWSGTNNDVVRFLIEFLLKIWNKFDCTFTIE